ncbi:13853_t:CDS:2, partial [Cetraspora pellucida]
MEQAQVFTCQRCKHTLRIDDTLTDLGSTSIDILLAPLPEEVIRTSDSSTVNRRSETVEINRNSKQSNNIDQNGISVPRKRSGSKNLGLSRSPSREISTKESFLLPSESYVMLSRSQVAQPLNNQVSPEHGTIDTNSDDRQRASLSYRLKVANRLFDLMSSRSEIDHPMCQECTDMLLDSLSKQLSDASRERDCYIDFLKKIN